MTHSPPFWPPRAILLVGLATACSASPGTQPQIAALDACQTVLTTTSGGAITDDAGNTWTLTPAGEVDENGAAVPGGAGTAQLTLDASGTLWGQDVHSGGWYAWRNGTWNGPSGSPVGTHVCGDCTCQIVLTPASGGSIKDDAGNTWTLSPTGEVDENGAAVPGGAGTAQLTLDA
ncbi:MAG TPA: hypothetical protein VFP84_01120, partial [Kofleriaceae bacterium]|nr:hypothetical protein [Kofleriaceae bacterium]